MSRVVLVLVEAVNDYLPLLEQAGFELIRAPTRPVAPKPLLLKASVLTPY